MGVNIATKPISGPPQASSMNSVSGEKGGGVSIGAPTQQNPKQHIAQNSAGAVGGAVGGAAGVSKGGPNADLAGILSSLSELLGKLTALLQGQAGGVGGAAGGPPGGDGCCCDSAGAAPEASKIQTAVKGDSGPAQAASFGAQTAAPAIQPSSGGREQNSYEQRVLDLMNQERAKYGLRPLQYNAALDSAATKHNAVQAQNRTMAHIDIGDGDPGSRIRAAGWTGQWGENVAVGQTSPEQVVQEWMNSPTHRANILNPNYTSVGVSYTATGDGFPFWAESFGG